MNTQNLKTIIPLKLRKKIEAQCGFFPTITAGTESAYHQAQQTIYIDTENPFENQIQHAVFHELAHFIYRNIGKQFHKEPNLNTGAGEGYPVFYAWEESMCDSFADGMMKVCKYE